jgi:surface carbohydrate biosynthesis protein (TIGR04326 family)
MEKMNEVEALRYIHLKKIIAENNNHDKLNIQKKKILVLGDIVFTTTKSMLNLLESISEYLKHDWCLTLKLHPANPVKLEDYSKLDLELTEDPLGQLLPYFQIVITSIYTAAVLDVHSVGLPIITILDDNDFNTSPLYGVKGINFLSTSVELKVALMRYSTKSSNKSTEELFWLDPELPRWKDLLGLDQKHTTEKITTNIN